jgi:hypothetical protein
LFSFGSIYSVEFLSGSAGKGIYCRRLVVGMMVTIDTLKHLKGNAEEATDLVYGYPNLSLPSDSGVPQRVRVTSGPSAERNALLMRLTGSPCHSIRKSLAIFSRLQQRTSASRRGGILIDGCRFFVLFMPAVRR